MLDKWDPRGGTVIGRLHCAHSRMLRWTLMADGERANTIKLYDLVDLRLSSFMAPQLQLWRSYSDQDRIDLSNRVPMRFRNASAIWTGPVA